MKAGPAGLEQALPSSADVETIRGRAILANGEEFVCTARNVTPAGADLSASIAVEEGQTLVCHLDDIGLLPAKVVTVNRHGFRVAFTLTKARLGKVTAQLEWHAGRASRRADLRRSPRIVPLHRSVEVWLGEHLARPGTIQNISMSGVAIGLDADAVPFIGSRIRIGSRFATVVRMVDGGIAAEFAEPFTPDNFDERVRP